MAKELSTEVKHVLQGEVLPPCTCGGDEYTGHSFGCPAIQERLWSKKTPEEIKDDIATMMEAICNG